MRSAEPQAVFLPTAREVLQYLQMKLGYGLWMVTRTSGADITALVVEDHCYSISEGDTFSWSECLCSRMVDGDGPRIAPKSSDFSAYAEAQMNNRFEIGSYVGLPLRRQDGNLFGTLCAMDPCPQPEEIAREEPQLEILARLLETILETELQAEEERRRAERAEALAMTDALTGLFNRRGWDELVAAEESRCERYSHPAAVISIDLDDLKTKNDSEGHAAGDELLKQAGRIILQNIRKTDIAARVGGDEFLILAVECRSDGISTMTQRLSRALDAQQVGASIGYGIRTPQNSLANATEYADKAMYENKRERKSFKASG